MGHMMTDTWSTTPATTTEFKALRNCLAQHAESEIFLLSAYQDWPSSPHPTSTHPINIAIFECIYLTPQHIAFAIFLATKYSIDVIGFTVLGDNDEECFFVAEDHPFFDFYFPRPFGPGLPFIPEPKPAHSFATGMLGRASFHASRSMDCYTNCAVDVYGAPGVAGGSLILCPSHSDPSRFTPLCVSTPTTNISTLRVIPPTHTPRLRLWDYFFQLDWITKWPDFAAEAHWSSALALASRPVLPAPEPTAEAVASPSTKVTFKLRPTAAAWFPRRQRTRRPCHSRPAPDPIGRRRPQLSSAFYDLRNIAYAHRQWLPRPAPAQVEEAVAPLAPLVDQPPKSPTQQPVGQPSPAAPNHRPRHGRLPPPTVLARRVSKNRTPFCGAFIYLLLIVCLTMYITEFPEVAKQPTRLVDLSRSAPPMSDRYSLLPSNRTWQALTARLPFYFTAPLLEPDPGQGKSRHTKPPLNPATHCYCYIMLSFEHIQLYARQADPSAQRTWIG